MTAKCAGARLELNARTRLLNEPGSITETLWMISPQSRQADQTRIIELLARESEFPIDEVAHLYEEELAELGIGARITSFLPIFAIRNVREALRKRGAARRGGTCS